jgi:hypothetical protein
VHERNRLLRPFSSKEKKKKKRIFNTSAQKKKSEIKKISKIKRET